MSGDPEKSARMRVPISTPGTLPIAISHTQRHAIVPWRTCEPTPTIFSKSTGTGVRQPAYARSRSTRASRSVTPRLRGDKH